MDIFLSQDYYNLVCVGKIRNFCSPAYPHQFFFYVRELLGSKTSRKDQMHFLHSRTYVDSMSHCQATQSSVGFAMNHKENLTGTWTPNNFSKASYAQYHFRKCTQLAWNNMWLHCCHCFMLWMPEIWHSLIDRLRKSLTVVMFPTGKLNCSMYSAAKVPC